MLDSLSMLLDKKESLNPALRPYINKGPLGLMIQHPLIQEIMYREQMNALINKRFEVKVEALNEAVDSKNWNRVIWLHERPWRIEALIKYQGQMSDTQYWECVGAVWIDSENIWQRTYEWRTLWENPRKGRRFAMDAKERKQLALMPDTIQVFRGVHGKGITKQRHRIGMSWTTDREKAEWFANRWAPQHPIKVLEGTVKKYAVHAYFIGRNESEIVSSSVQVAK